MRKNILVLAAAAVGTANSLAVLRAARWIHLVNKIDVRQLQ